MPANQPLSHERPIGMMLPQRIILIEKPQAEPVSIAEQLGYDLIAPARPSERVSGGGGEVIDLSNSRAARRRSGGHDPMAQQVITKWEITGPVKTGHTRNFDDEAEPIIVREADTLHPVAGGTGYVEGRCMACIAKPDHRPRRGRDADDPRTPARLPVDGRAAAAGGGDQ